MLSFVVSPVLAAPDTTIITPKAKAANQLEEHVLNKISEQAKTHNSAHFSNEVPGVGGLKYEGEQLPPGFEHTPETVTMVSWQNEGKLHIRDTNHKTVSIQIPWGTLQDIEGFDGQHVRIWHYNDAGVCDGEWVQTVSNEGGYAYFEEVPFSEIIVGGFTGTYSKINNEIGITDTISLGRTFDSDDVSSLTLEIEDQYADKTDPYDIPTDGLVGWWRFDEAGSTVIDYSGNGNNGTFEAATYTTGKYNNGGSFDGVDDYAEISHNSDFNLTEFTIIADVNISMPNTLSPSARVLVGKGSLFTSNYILYYDTSTQKIAFGYWDGSDLQAVSTNVITQNTSYNVIGTYDGQDLKLYLDNHLENSFSSLTTPLYNTNSFLIGGASGRESNCIIDNVLVYNYSLSNPEIEDYYYIKASSLQAKTNSHSEYSTEWNSSADNPLSVPYGASESISSLTFNQPESIEQNGVTIYNPINVLFNVTATIGYTEDTYLIEEFCDEGFYVDQYAVEISHTPSASNANGLVSYNPTDSMCSDIMSKSWTYELETNNPNASITTFNMNSLIIDTGAITAGTEYTYTVIAETSDEVANTELESDISSAIAMSGILPMLLVVASILGLLIGTMTGNIEYDTAVKSVGAVIFLSIVLYVGIAILNTIATALG